MPHESLSWRIREWTTLSLDVMGMVQDTQRMWYLSLNLHLNSFPGAT